MYNVQSFKVRWRTDFSWADSCFQPLSAFKITLRWWYKCPQFCSWNLRLPWWISHTVYLCGKICTCITHCH